MTSDSILQRSILTHVDHMGVDTDRLYIFFQDLVDADNIALFAAFIKEYGVRYNKLDISL